MLANLDKMVVKPAYPHRDFDSVFAVKLPLAQREQLKAKIRARPHFYIAQEQVALSTAPVMVENKIQPRHAVLRTYLAASEGTFSVMPGGLTQVPTSAESLVFSLQRGRGQQGYVGAVVGTGEQLQPAAPRAGHAIELTRGGGDLPSRVADNLFWLGRYVERAESAVRLMRGIANRLSEKSIWGDVKELNDLMRALRHQGGTASGKEREAPSEPTAVGDELRMLLEESRHKGGLYSTLRQLQSTARAVRDRISTDTWRVVNSLQEDAAWPKELDDLSLGEIIQRLNVMVTTLASFGGLASESMTRGQVWLVHGHGPAPGADDLHGRAVCAARW